MSDGKSQFDQLWCGGCYTIYKRHHADGEQCPNCEDSELSETVALWRRVVSWVGSLVALGIAAALFLGPPAAIVHRLLSGGPLFETREVTVTVRSGLVFDVIPLLVLWALILTIVYVLAFGPRSMGRSF